MLLPIGGGDEAAPLAAEGHNIACADADLRMVVVTGILVEQVWLDLDDGYLDGLAVGPRVGDGDAPEDFVDECEAAVAVGHDDGPLAVAGIDHELGLEALVDTAVGERPGITRSANREAEAIPPGPGVSIRPMASADRTTFDSPRTARCTSTATRARSVGVVQRPAAAISG